MNSLPTPPHVSSSWSWPSSRRRRLDEEQGSFGEFSDKNDTIAIAIAIPLSTEIEQQDTPQMRGAAPQNSWNNSMPLNESEPGSGIMSYAVPIEQQDGPPQMQGAAPQNSWNNSMPLNESEPGSGIMSYAVPIILGVAQLLIGLHLFGVF